MIRKEEIEKASVNYQMSKHPMAIGGDAFADTIYKVNLNPSFIAGAEWADQHPRKELVDKEKVEQWIIGCFEFLNDAGDHNLKIDKFIENFRIAMEE